MKRLCAIVVILIPLAMTAAQARTDSRSAGDLPQYLDPPVLMKHSETNQCLRSWSFPGRYGPNIASKEEYSGDNDLKKRSIRSRKDLDLRYVDWDEIKAGRTSKSRNAETEVDGAENGNGDDEQQDENRQENGQDEKDEGGGGWDRLWDAPKLG